VLARSRSMATGTAVACPMSHGSRPVVMHGIGAYRCRGGCAVLLRPLYELIRAHVFAGERVHGDETPVPVLAKHETRKGRLWAYVRDDKPFAGPAPPAAVFFYSRDRTAQHPESHLRDYAGILQADAYAGFNRLYEADRKPGPITETRDQNFFWL